MPFRATFFLRHPPERTRMGRERQSHAGRNIRSGWGVNLSDPLSNSSVAPAAPVARAKVVLVVAVVQRCTAAGRATGWSQGDRVSQFVTCFTQHGLPALGIAHVGGRTRPWNTFGDACSCRRPRRLIPHVRHIRPGMLPDAVADFVRYKRGGVSKSNAALHMPHTDRAKRLFFAFSSSSHETCGSTGIVRLFHLTHVADQAGENRQKCYIDHLCCCRLRPQLHCDQLLEAPLAASSSVVPVWAFTTRGVISSPGHRITVYSSGPSYVSCGPSSRKWAYNTTAR